MAKYELVNQSTSFNIAPQLCHSGGEGGCLATAASFPLTQVLP